MRASTLSLALSALVTLAAAKNFTIDPNEVDIPTRASWCQAETNNCGLLCGSAPSSNSCNVNTLDFSCICTNGTAPGLEYYTGTMPTFICQQAYKDCIFQNQNNLNGQNKCISDIQAFCGTLDPVNATTSASSSSSAASGGATTAPSASASGAGSQTTSAAASGASAPATTSSSTGPAPTVAVYLGHGMAVAAAGLFVAML